MINLYHVSVTKFSFFNVQQFCLSHNKYIKKKRKLTVTEDMKRPCSYKEVDECDFEITVAHICSCVFMCPVRVTVAQAIVSGFMVTLRHV